MHILHASCIGRETNLAELIEYVVKIYQDLALGNFGNVIHGLTGIISYSRILI